VVSAPGWSRDHDAWGTTLAGIPHDPLSTCHTHGAGPTHVAGHTDEASLEMAHRDGTQTW